MSLLQGGLSESEAHAEFSNAHVGTALRAFAHPTFCFLTGVDDMPWTSGDAQRHTHKATTPELQQLWAKVANEALQRLGDESQAIREANAVVARQTGER